MGNGNVLGVGEEKEFTKAKTAGFSKLFERIMMGVGKTNERWSTQDRSLCWLLVGVSRNKPHSGKRNTMWLFAVSTA